MKSVWIQTINNEITSCRKVNHNRRLNRDRLHFIDSGISVIVRIFRDFLNTFGKIWCQNKCRFSVYSNPSFNANFLTISVLKGGILEIQQQKVNHANNIIVSYLNINTFSTNVPLVLKPGSWFLLAKCLKNTCVRVTF